MTEPPPQGWLLDIPKSGWEGGALKGPRAGACLGDGQISGDVGPRAEVDLAADQTTSDKGTGPAVCQTSGSVDGILFADRLIEVNKLNITRYQC